MVGFAVLAAPLGARAAEYYVAPTGSDTAAGTMAAPFATVTRGQTAASAGDTVWIRGGVYMFSGTTVTVGVNLSKSGGTNNPIKYFAYPGETPIFDFYNLKPQQRVTGFNVQCNWVHLKGLEVRGIQQQVTGDCWGVRLQGSNNVVEAMNIHHGQAPGVFITSGANNLILNCDSHENYDPLEGGGNGDGFGCHSSGGGNVIRGCRAWSNSDDGYDFINASGSCTVENSWSWSNGYRARHDDGVGQRRGLQGGRLRLATEFPRWRRRDPQRQPVPRVPQSRAGLLRQPPPGPDQLLQQHGDQQLGQLQHAADSGYPSDHVIRNNLATGSGGTIST